MTTPPLAFVALGVPPEDVHQKLFYADDDPAPPTRHKSRTGQAPASQLTVILDGRATTTAVPLDRSVLDSAQRIRPDLPFACKGGVCGTCRALLTQGQADMRRNFALEAAEVAAGYILTCQTYPLSDTLIVDFDS